MGKQDAKRYIEQHLDELHRLFVRLARIPAPSGQEQRRAAFCLEWLRSHGAEDAYMDPAGNVVWIYQNGSGCGTEAAQADPECAGGCCGRKAAQADTGYAGSGRGMESSLIVFMAHMDVVFPDTDPLPLYEQDGRIYCPGSGDDTANLAILLMAAEYVAVSRPDTGNRGLVFVCGVGEEGLGNLKGSREICREFGDRMEAFYGLDLTMKSYTARAVGSLRYRITVGTEGGHSYHCFGNTNANQALADLIQRLYRIQPPKRGKTTYNVGMISGGTSVNTIADRAEMLFEIRSDDEEDLEEMRRLAADTVQSFQADYAGKGGMQEEAQPHQADYAEKAGNLEEVQPHQAGYAEKVGNLEEVQPHQADYAEKAGNLEEVQLHQAGYAGKAEIQVEIIGERPCEGAVEKAPRERLFRLVEEAVEAETGIRPRPESCSTDCNIPLSMGIPSVCVGLYRGAGMHTREEYVEKDSLRDGFAIALRLVENYAK